MKLGHTNDSSGHLFLAGLETGALETDELSCIGSAKKTLEALRRTGQLLQMREIRHIHREDEAISSLSDQTAFIDALPAL